MIETVGLDIVVQLIGRDVYLITVMTSEDLQSIKSHIDFLICVQAHVRLVV